ncbi:calcineurin-like phosphoesterase [Purpureocillium lavendulum]|uniref:Calcineurin-like phosphoesterase n=1 Tax=Purpureocillium lavendulum TaxID=1247861 RepID=A0AB34FE21_9HYPO|nr:calcineurin-like phosphoesterase [Purpureocillium lavendulum]
MLSSPARTPVAAQPRLIRISECLSSKYFEVYVREIVRAEIVGVTTSDLYPKYALGCGGNASSIPTAYAYALVDLNAVEEAFANYIPNITGSVLRRFVGPADSLLHKTYRMACQMCQDPTTPSDSKEILKSTFKLWTAVRLSTLPTFIVGDETLKMSQLALDQPQPLAGKINMPPVTSAQLEVVLVHYIQGTLRPSVLRKLQDMECRKKKDTWLVIYLATFILLHNITLLMAHGASEPLDCVTNRSVADTQEYLREAHWRELKSHASYNHDYYFISQLFEENWQPPIPQGDVLIHAGDLSQSGHPDEIQQAISWLSSQPHKYKIVIAGNADLFLDKSATRIPRVDHSRHAIDGGLNWGDIRYLDRSTTTIVFEDHEASRSLTIYGDPNVPRCGPNGQEAFQYDADEDYWRDSIPSGTDILITHTPPKYILDEWNGALKHWNGLDATSETIGRI